ncbi:hypothetical protein SAMN05216389_10413 [Oceanobacillus limi]|uniref:Uncharacterized protein n=1 Tax=Oceanobacillus limi TaxID=930131 RepID=A0A1I0AT81_9BACI|nr:hypothetical protein [Oceanobacillus limi]SES97108.1 hypothetical protein SAMN05216389_10413 [Oceanobacillus limi]
MKRYLTAIFLLLGAIILIIGLPIDLQWTGAVTWLLTLICLIFAAYFTKYIPDKDNEKNSRK